MVQATSGHRDSSAVTVAGLVDFGMFAVSKHQVMQQALPRRGFLEKHDIKESIKV